MLHVKSFTYGPFQENSYIVYNDANECIIIDPGMYEAQEENEFFNYITQHNLKPIQIVNTHCHLDHIFGVQAVINKYNIPFTFHALEQQVYDWAADAGLKYGVPVKATPPPNYYLNNTNKIIIGSEELEIRFAPGHSPGHVILYSATCNFAIVGDVIFEQSIGRTDLPGGDMETLIQSIHTQIFTLPTHTTLYCGHGPSTNVGFEKMNNPFLT